MHGQKKCKSRHQNRENYTARLLTDIGSHGSVPPCFNQTLHFSKEKHLSDFCGHNTVLIPFFTGMLSEIMIN